MKTSTLCRNKATEMSRDIALEQTLEVMILGNFVFLGKPRKKGNCSLTAISCQVKLATGTLVLATASTNIWPKADIVRRDFVKRVR